jgi:hypothetical protein
LPKWLLGYHCQRRWIRHLRSSARWQAMFPYLPNQPGYHKRLKAAHPLLCTAILTLAACCPSWFDDLWMTDATPVPCGMSRERAKRSDLVGHAGYGYCASHSRYYWRHRAGPAGRQGLRRPAGVAASSSARASPAAAPTATASATFSVPVRRPPSCPGRRG